MPYADFLIPIFDRFYRAERKQTDVRLFTEIIRLLVGGESHTESIGLSPVLMAVMETNGAICSSQTFSSPSYPGAPATPLHVLTDPFDAALTGEPADRRAPTGVGALAPECRELRGDVGLWRLRNSLADTRMKSGVMGIAKSHSPTCWPHQAHIHRTVERISPPSGTGSGRGWVIGRIWRGSLRIRRPGAPPRG